MAFSYAIYHIFSIDIDIHRNVKYHIKGEASTVFLQFFHVSDLRQSRRLCRRCSGSKPHGPSGGPSIPPPFPTALVFVCSPPPPLAGLPPPLHTPSCGPSI